MRLKKSKADSRSVFTPLGASNHSSHERETNDFYATEPKALELLLEVEKFSHHVWECACGKGHLSDVLKEHGHDVKSSDLIDRGYCGTVVQDFLSVTKEDIRQDFPRDIITNPPYSQGMNFVKHALELSENGTKIAMFLKVLFLEGQARRKLFEEYPPKTIYVSSSRLLCAKNGDFESVHSSAIAYAWYIWEKGYSGDTVIKWFN